MIANRTKRRVKKKKTFGLEAEKVLIPKTKDNGKHPLILAHRNKTPKLPNSSKKPNLPMVSVQSPILANSFRGKL
jgi:hypothetical protein